jgi:pimeloyl-ACP methyl ester carboxylesterase
VHHKRAGVGEPLIVLLHGFGANTSSWRSVMAPLAELGTFVWHDPSRLMPEDIATYRKPTQYDDCLRFGERVADLGVLALVITGDDDPILPTANRLRLACELPNAAQVRPPSTGAYPRRTVPGWSPTRPKSS